MLRTMEFMLDILVARGERVEGGEHHWYEVPKHESPGALRHRGFGTAQAPAPETLPRASMTSLLAPELLRLNVDVFHQV